MTCTTAFITHTEAYQTSTTMLFSTVAAQGFFPVLGIRLLEVEQVAYFDVEVSRVAVEIPWVRLRQGISFL